jgi:hypothetical protein
MTIEAIKEEVKALPAEDRRRLSAFLISLRHRDLEGYRARMAERIDDPAPENWLTMEELDERLNT